MSGPRWAAVAVSAALSLFFRLALVGYGTLSLCLAALAALLLADGLLHRKNKRWLRRVLWLLVAAGLVFFLICVTPVVISARGDEGPAADYLIVLGAGVNGTVPSRSLRDRLDAAEAYLRANPDCVAILSGGQGPGEDITEAEAMYRTLTAAGIAPQRLVKEDRSTSTEENLAYSLALVDDPAAHTLAVVSSEYHLYRAKLMAEENHGLALLGIPAATAYPVLKLNYFIREGFAVAYLRVFA